MLSQEFIPTSSSDEDFLTNRRPIKTVKLTIAEDRVTSTSKNTSTNTNTCIKTVTGTQVNTTVSISTTVHPLTTTNPSNTVTLASSNTSFSTNPDAIKFVPQPPVHFYYSLHKNSLRTVIDTLLSAQELGHLCNVFKVPCYGRWIRKKKMVADLLVDFMLNLKQAYARDQFNELVDKINAMKGKEFLGKIPRLPEKIDALKVLKGSLNLANKITRPHFPVRLNSPLKEVTGLIFLDEVDEALRNNFTMDLFFTLPPGIENMNSNLRFILCIYQSSERITSATSTSTLDTTVSLSPVSPTLLDLTLNGSVLEQGNCRFRNHDSFDITLLCYKDRANLLRIIRHETHVDLSHLIMEIVAVSLAGSLSEARPVGAGVCKPREPYEQLSDEINTLREKYLKEDLILEELSFKESFSRLTTVTNSDELEILEDCMKFSLKCPISFTRIRQPVKFRTCRHGQCFDFSNWKQITQSILKLRLNGTKTKYPTKVTCPICGENESEGGKLIIDGMFKKFLEGAGKDDVSVEINLKDGNFKYEQESEESESDFDNSCSDEDVIIEITTKTTNTSSCTTNTSSNAEIISLTDSSDDELQRMLTYKIDKSKPIGSCPSRAITID